MSITGYPFDFPDIDPDDEDGLVDRAIEMSEQVNGAAWRKAVKERPCPFCKRAAGEWCIAVVNGVVTDRELVKPHNERLEGK